LAQSQHPPPRKPSSDTLVLQPVHCLKAEDGKQRLAALSPVALARRAAEVDGVAFRAVVIKPLAGWLDSDLRGGER
jgi:hypothetical protein